jgi:hypothetical protein
VLELGVIRQVVPCQERWVPRSLEPIQSTLQRHQHPPRRRRQRLLLQRLPRQRIQYPILLPLRARQLSPRLFHKVDLYLPVELVVEALPQQTLLRLQLQIRTLELLGRRLVLRPLLQFPRQAALQPVERSLLQ